MTDATLLAAVRHNCWANVELIKFCSTLTPEQLAWTIPGATYGSIHQTLQHTIRAELGYLAGLAGQPPPTALPQEKLAPLSEILDHARSNAERMERVLSDGFDPDRRITRPSGTVATARVIAARAGSFTGSRYSRPLKLKRASAIRLGHGNRIGMPPRCGWVRHESGLGGPAMISSAPTL